MRPRTLATALAALAMTAPLTITTTTPAQAAGSISTCYTWISPSAPGHAGGWCDGTGPDWTYRGIVRCSNGTHFLGISRWAGDRRGSSGTCASTRSAVSGGVRVYYKGVWQFDRLRFA